MECNMRFLATLLVAATLVTFSEVPALSKITIIGLGTQSCGNWTEERRSKGSPAEMALTTWVVGYLSGVNEVLNEAYKQPDLLQAKDVTAYWAWIDNYCRANPLDTVYLASTNLVKDLIKRAPPK
jgi:hypothetical protein